MKVNGCPYSPRMYSLLDMMEGKIQTNPSPIRPNILLPITSV